MVVYCGVNAGSHFEVTKRQHADNVETLIVGDESTVAFHLLATFLFTSVVVDLLRFHAVHFGVFETRLFGALDVLLKLLVVLVLCLRSGQGLGIRFCSREKRGWDQGKLCGQKMQRFEDSGYIGKS